MGNYIETARELVDRETQQISGPLPDALVDLYTLLACVKGADVSLKDVHDAWALWISREKPWHHSAIPFEELTAEVQEMDRPYAEAIARACRATSNQR